MSDSAIAIGSHISHYQITGKLGVGGMGEVYRARDSKLNREVAIKVLPQGFAQDAERIARFQREAQALASLNHPNIAAIYGVEESHGIRALVMELVEGPTLADRIDIGPVPLDESLAIARQIIDALEAAHECGVIHRDLKPANVKVTPDDKVKVLDFGLAKMAFVETPSTDLSHSPTMPLPTQAGVILGTAAYMSPEQAKGKIVDKRADIWAFGALLFEMLSARRCFGGETLTDTLAAVVRAEPNWEHLPADTPPSTIRLLRHCLTKDPKQRLRDIGDARFELERPGEPKDAQVGIVAATARGWRTPLTLGLLVLAALTGGVLLSRFLDPRTSPPSRVIRLIHTIPSDQTPSGQSRRRLAISPAGDKLVYVANNRLYLRALNALDAVELTGTDAAMSPFFSPDGEWVGFLARGQLTKAPVNGGPPVFICKIGDADGVEWGLDNTILIGGAFEGILRVPADGGNPVVLVSPSPSLAYANPQFLPDGHSFLFQRGQPGNSDTSELVMRSVDKNDETVVFHGAYEYQYVKPGYLLVSQGARNQPLDLSIVRFDASARKVVGNPTTILRNVGYESLVSSSNFAVSDFGTLIYFQAPQVEGSGTRLAAVDRSGKASVLPSEARDYSDPRVSPDGRFVAAHLMGDQNDVWVADVTRGALTRLSHDLGEDETPAWSPDGRTIAWAASRSDLVGGVFRRAADGSGAEELVWRADNHCHVRDWSPDGRTLVLEIQGVNSSTDIWRLNLEGTPTATVFLQTRFNERNSRLSPGGRWLAYVSDESGRDEVYIQAFPQGGSKLQISSTGGDEPVWSRDGRKLYFRGGGSIRETAFHADAQPSVDAAVALFPDTFESPQGEGHTGYDVFPDGRFLMIQFRTPGAREEIVVVVNWIEELKGR